MLDWLSRHVGGDPVLLVLLVFMIVLSALGVSIWGFGIAVHDEYVSIIGSIVGGLAIPLVIAFMIRHAMCGTTVPSPAPTTVRHARCPKCRGAVIRGTDARGRRPLYVCASCGWSPGDAVSPSDDVTPVHGTTGRYWPALVIIALLVWFIGSYHIVLSSDGIDLVHKVHFTFAETFVSMDEITGMPYIAAKAKYPLAIKALQREGKLESDYEFEHRVRRELESGW